MNFTIHPCSLLGFALFCAAPKKDVCTYCWVVGIYLETRVNQVLGTSLHMPELSVSKFQARLFVSGAPAASLAVALRCYGDCNTKNHLLESENAATSISKRRTIPGSCDTCDLACSKVCQCVPGGLLDPPKPPSICQLRHGRARRSSNAEAWKSLPKRR